MVENKLQALKRYKKALPKLKKLGKAYDVISNKIIEYSAELGFSSSEIDLLSIWEEESKKTLYSTFITPKEALLIQTYGCVKEDKLISKTKFIHIDEVETINYEY